ncbi:MAG: serine/threonine-protein kinase PknK [Deltaproteobacteria bacterium]|nr:MAG: serine/threonine-protein kinase PknK [Deltaproteobacteria bacterium]
MEPGALLGEQFEIEQQIRAGGMGEVFRGRDRASGAAVAVKVIAGSRGLRTARFAREVELLAQLSHPGIVRYVSHGATASGELFLVMEWLDGEDLKARLERAPLTLRESVVLAARVADALGTAHARGIVHRDLKPSNLFLPAGRIEHVKVIDFGIAQKAGLSQLTRTGTMIGTPGYMAPEQARDQGTVDARADVYALGCVLFQCLTGTPAFEGDNAIAILGKILFGEAPRVSALWSEVPEDLDALVARMLSKDPALRPGDGASLAAALAALGPRVHSAAVAPGARAPRPPAITGSERRFLSVVLLGSPGADLAADADLQADDALRRAVAPYGGRIEQLADGSTIIVLEAERQAATDQAAQAARCALALHALARGRPMAVAMGRAASSRKLPEDDVIDRASRLISHIAPGSEGLPPIALDEVSAGLLDARFDVVETDAHLALYGERALMQGARTLLGRPTSCVGRDWELNALTGILDECIDESRVRVAMVTAAAGMGKSRLATEFVTRVQRRGGIAIWVGRGDSLRAGSTLDLLAQALRGAVGIHGGEPLAERRDKLSARVAERVPAGEHKRVTEFLGELIGASFPGEGEAGAALRAARQDAQLMSEQMLKAWMDFLQAETRVHPVLLVLEDLHWGDFGTVRFIDTALRDRSEQPWMVLALARPELFEVFPKLWVERHNVQEIRLKELGRRAGERLVRQVLGDGVGPDTLDHLVKQADGNAFYLEELIRASAEGKDKALPETVLAMVETRLGRLAVEARRVLRAAAVFGEVCWEGGVVVLLEGAMGPATVAEWLAKLVEQEVLAMRQDSRFPGERELVFRHSLLREGAYATLTDDDKRLGHHLAGEWLAQHGEADPMVLAGHFERGGEGTRAASYYLRASEQAYYVVDLEATMARLAQGLACAPPQELRFALLGLRCEVSGAGLKTISAAMPDAEELIRSAPRGSLPWAQGAIAYLEGTTLAGRMGDFFAAIALLKGVVPVPGAVARTALAFLSGVCILDVIGQVPDGNALEERFFAVVRSAGDHEPMARFWCNVTVGMRAAYAHEDPWTALEHSGAIRATFDVIGRELVFLNMQLFRGMNLWFLGAFAQAEQTLGGIEAADEALGVASSLRRFSLSWLLADRGALDAARVLATQLREYGRAHHNPLEEGRGRWVLAEVLRRIGDFDGAERELEVALGMAMPLEQPGALATLSVLRRVQGRAGDALAAAEDAVARCTAMGGCGMFRGAFVRLAHAEALHATGAHDAARRAIADARTRLVTVAERIPDPEYRKSFLESVSENARTLALARAWFDETLPDT